METESRSLTARKRLPSHMWKVQPYRWKNSCRMRLNGFLWFGRGRTWSIGCLGLWGLGFRGGVLGGFSGRFCSSLRLSCHR